MFQKEKAWISFFHAFLLGQYEIQKEKSSN